MTDLTEIRTALENMAVDMDAWQAVHTNYESWLAELVERCERAEAALREYDRWASRMPDAGFTDQSPRWTWWHERPRAVISPIDT